MHGAVRVFLRGACLEIFWPILQLWAHTKQAVSTTTVKYRDPGYLAILGIDFAFQRVYLTTEIRK